MAEVWLAKHSGAGGFERIVAIKRLLPHLMDDDESIGMFIDEAKIAAQLTHSNIAQLYCVGT
jgi:serine/threonine protein kinase